MLRTLSALAGLCLLVGRAAARDASGRTVTRDKTPAQQAQKFFALSAQTPGGKIYRMDDFEGSVVVIVTAPRTCDDGVFFKALEHLHKLHPYSLEIVAFPFTNADADIAACRADLLAREEKGSATLRLAAHAAINGPDAPPLLRHLKAAFELDALPEAFPTYFFVDPAGVPLEVHHGAGFDTLRRFVNKYEDAGREL